ncbi:MAG: acetyl-CoA carboxylase biotin carboxylase subunit family protein, partial [Kiritimatiellia bacterium]
MKSKLVIIGASYLQRPLVRRAMELGYDTHVFAWREGAVCREIADHYYPISVTDRAAILAECRSIRPVGVVSIASEVAAATVNYLASALGLPGNSRECSRLTGNKHSMRQALLTAGVPGPAFQLASESVIQDLPLRFPLIVKPVDRSGSRGVTLVEIPRALPAAIVWAREQSFCGDAIIEEYLEGRELSIEAVSFQGQHHVLQFTDKQTGGPPHFVEVAHHQPAALT